MSSQCPVAGGNHTKLLFGAVAKVLYAILEGEDQFCGLLDTFKSWITVKL